MTTIPLRPAPLRLIVVAALAAGLGFLCWTIARTAFGSSLMTFAQRAAEITPESRVDAAQIARKYAPEDPLVRYGAGGILMNTATSEFNEKLVNDAVDELALAAKLSPLDYRMWLALGRGLDRQGKSKEARQAFEKAIELAPNHFDPHWALGNYLLRNGENDAAFAELSAALRSRPSSLDLIFEYAWKQFGGDAQAITRVLKPPDSVRAQFVSYFIDRDKAADALVIWREGGFDQVAPEINVRTVTESLIRNDHVSDAYAVWFASKNTEHPGPDAHSLLSNGDFEKPITIDSVVPFFTWQIKNQRGVTIAIDKQTKVAGLQSYRSGFDIRENSDVIFVSQTVPVKRSTAYVLMFAAQTRGFENLSNPQLEVTDTGKAERMTRTLPQMKNGDTDWRHYDVEFTTSAATDAVTVKVRRPACGDPPCPFAGRLWLDDFSLVEKKNFTPQASSGQ